MSSEEVVLDRAGLVRVGGGVLVLAALGFVAGAVVGFGMNGGAAEGFDLEALQAGGDPPEALAAALAAACPPTGEAAAAGEGGEEGGGGMASLLRLSAVPGLGAAGEGAAAPGAAEAGPGAADAAFEASSLDRTAPPESAAAQERGEAEAGRYAVQVGVFGVEENAERLAERLRHQGYDPLVTALRNRSGQWLQRVHLSVYGSEASAREAARSFTEREGIPAVVVALHEESR